MLWCNNLPIKQRRRLFPSALPQGMLSVHFLLAVQKKVNMRFYFLVVQKESVKGQKFFKGDIRECRLWDRDNPLF